MQIEFLVHKRTYSKWPAKGTKSAGEAWDFDLLDMSLPADDAYRGTLPYRLTDDERVKYWDGAERKPVIIAVHEIQHTLRGPVVRGRIVKMGGDLKK